MISFIDFGEFFPWDYMLYKKDIYGHRLVLHSRIEVAEHWFSHPVLVARQFKFDRETIMACCPRQLLLPVISRGCHGFGKGVCM